MDTKSSMMLIEEIIFKAYIGSAILKDYPCLAEILTEALDKVKMAVENDAAARRLP